MPIYQVNAPDGKTYKVNAPDGATQEDAIKYVQENFYKPTDVQMPKEDKGMVQNLLAGALKGATDIGTTLLTPVDAAYDLVTGNKGTHDWRKQELAKFFDENANTDSLSFKGGELGSGIAGTAGAGGVMAKGLTQLPTLAKYAPSAANTLAKVRGVSSVNPTIGAALETGGLSLGGATATTGKELLKNAATRVGAGAVSGAAMAGLVNPDEAGTGALIGAALPPSVAALGSVGRFAKTAVIDPLVNQEKLIGELLARASNGKAAGVAPKTAGVKFSTGQQTGDAGLLALEDAIAANNPKGALSTQAQNNRNVLADSLRGLTGDEIAIGAAESARTRATNPLYHAASNSQNQVDVQRTINLIDGVLEKNPGNRALVKALNDVKGTLVESAGTPERTVFQDRFGGIVQNQHLPSEPQLKNVLDLIKKAGGIDPSQIPDIGADISNKLYPGLFRRGGMTMDRVTELLNGHGWIPDHMLADLEANGVGGSHEYARDLIRGRLAGESVVHPADYDALAAYNKIVEDLQRSGVQKTTIPAKPATLRSNVGELMSSIDNIQALMQNKDNAFIRGQLNTVKKSIEHAINMADPNYRQANKLFANMSAPINQMQVGNLLANKLIPATSGAAPARLNASSLAGALRNPNQVAKQATDFAHSNLAGIMTPQQMALIKGVSHDASRIADTAAIGSGSGSATARRLGMNDLIGQHFGEKYPLLSQIMGTLGGVPGLNAASRIVGMGGKWVAGKINDQMLAKLEDALANDPQKVAALIAQAKAQKLPSRMGGLLESPLFANAPIQYGLLSQASP